MRLKEAKLCCAFSWSPAGTPNGLMVATGSVAGAMDEDFNSEAYLEIRSVDVHDTSSHELPVIGRTLMTDRVFRIDWSPHGGQYGMIAGCFTDGSVHVWSVDVILENFKVDPTTETNDPVLCRIEAHNGACRTLQFSPSQPHFLATGGQDKELKIWTLQDPKEPAVVPALTKASHPGEITDVKWNPKFAHILATATATGAVCVWDLKARRTALSFNVSANLPGAANCLAWHPDVSTHLAVARDDVSPVIQLWDLKKAMAPIRELRGHTKGITGMSWNSEDPSLLLSCGCDGRTICWNPTTGDLLGELPVQDNWIYEVQWCPKATAVLASASFESSLGVFSAQEIAAGGSGATRTVPKWLKRPCGATFGFGGRIAAPIKGSNNVSITITTRGDATSDKTFRESLVANPARTPERLALLKTLDFQLIAASEACALAGNREPLLNFLDVHPQQIEEAVDQLELPFRKDEEEFEDLLVQCIVSGRVAAGVKLCIAANRLDDGFAVAQLASQPSELTTRVVEAYVAVGRLRSTKYLKAVLCNAYDEIVQDPALPWREVLALLATFLPPDRFGPTADTLGKALDARKEQDGAAAAFVCSANVDAVADLYQNTFAPRKLVQLITVLEQTVGRACGATSFAQSLSQYATALANAGDFEGALLLSNRAAHLGDVAAAVVADRIQYHVPSAAAVRVGFPFTLALVPDATSIECHMLASKQQASPTTTAPQQQLQQQKSVAATQSTASPAQQQPQGFPNQQRPPQQQQQQYQPQPPQLPVGAGSSGYQGQQQQHPPNHHQQHQQQQVPQQFQPQTQQPQHAPQPNYPPPQQQLQHVPQQQQQQQQQQLPYPQQQAPPPQPPTEPNYRQSSPPIAAPPQQPQPQYRDPTNTAGQAPPPQPTTTALPLPPATTVQPQRLSPNVSSASLSRAGSQPSATLAPAAIASFDVSNLSNPTHQGIARGIIDATAKVTDKRKRDAIEKSAMELFERLRKGSIADGIADLILIFVQSVGTPTAKDNWRKLSDAHYDVVQHFLNIKFL